MSTNHYRQRQNTLSEILYSFLQDQGDEEVLGGYDTHITPQKASQAISEICMHLADLYEKDSSDTRKGSPLDQLCRDKYTAGGPNMPTLYLREISNPTPAETPEQEFVREWAEDAGVSVTAAWLLIQGLRKFKDPLL